jgi:RNA polymerase sigma factor (TIGR02999 family)
MVRRSVGSLDGAANPKHRKAILRDEFRPFHRPPGPLFFVHVSVSERRDVSPAHRFWLSADGASASSLTTAPENRPSSHRVNSNEITLILQRIEHGDEQAADRLLPLVYQQLRHLAAARMAREAPGQTLQPTALVHEAWLRLGADRQPDWKSRAQFFSAAAEAMRRILIDRARRRLAQRRRGRHEHLNIDDLDLAGAADDVRVLSVNEALEKLAIDDPRKAELVKLRYFAGLTLEEAARALEIAEPTARRWWAYARAWLLKEMSTTSR